VFCLVTSGYFITGTDTDVGKTHVATLLIGAFVNSGIDIGVMKPVSAGGREDAVAMMDAAGSKDTLDAVNPIALEEPLSPNLAAEREGGQIDLAKLSDAYTELASKHACMIVEGAGGLLVPLSDIATMADLAATIGLPLIVVARAALGTINHTLLTIEAAQSRNLAIVGVIYNQIDPPTGDPSETSSPEIVSRISGIPTLGTIPHGSLDLDHLSDHLDLTTLIGDVK
jgi:dethiobiotin synthetase